MTDWDAATWAQVGMAAVGLVVAIAATAVAWWTYRFTIDSQPVGFSFQRSARPAPAGVIPMHLVCISPRAYLHQVWSPTWEGGDADSVPLVRMFNAKDEANPDCPREDLSQGDTRMFSVLIPEGVSSFELVATSSVDKRGRIRNVWSERIVLSGSTSGGEK